MSHVCTAQKKHKLPRHLPSAVCTKPCCARRRPAGSDAPRCHLDREEGARGGERGTVRGRRRVHHHAHLQAQRASCQLWPSPRSRFISNMLMIRAAPIPEGLSKHNIKKNKKISLPVRGKQQKRVVSSPEQISPPAYQHAGEASPWLRCRLTGGGEARKTDGAGCTFSCHLLLHFGSPPLLFNSLSLSDSVSPRLAVPLRARLRSGARLRQRQRQRLTLNHHESGRIAELNPGTE